MKTRDLKARLLRLAYEIAWLRVHRLLDPSQRNLSMEKALQGLLLFSGEARGGSLVLAPLGIGRTLHVSQITQRARRYRCCVLEDQFCLMSC